MEVAEKQLIIMLLEQMQAGIARLKVTQDKYDFPSNKCTSLWEFNPFCK